MHSVFDHSCAVPCLTQHAAVTTLRSFSCCICNKSLNISPAGSQLASLMSLNFPAGSWIHLLKQTWCLTALYCYSVWGRPVLPSLWVQKESRDKRERHYNGSLFPFLQTAFEVRMKLFWPTNPPPGGKARLLYGQEKVWPSRKLD